MQELNVALGGSLHQHVPDLPGAKRHTDGARHGVGLTGASKTRDIVGRPRATVNSYHHQACRTLGKGLIPTAESPDGLVEGVESPRHRFVVGVQWHPERMQDDPRQQALFRALVCASLR
jgi:putative glutamine amidotransferase